MVTPAARQQAVAHLRQGFEVSQRRACSLVGADRSVIRYRSVRPDDHVVRGRLRELAAQRRRFGYRRLLILIRREGALVNHKKLRALLVNWSPRKVAKSFMTARHRLAHLLCMKSHAILVCS